MDCSRISELKKLAGSLVQGARMELDLTPKPGLVDLADSGSHPDLSVATMQRSIGYVSDYLDEIVLSLINDEPFVCQKNLGIKAERRLRDNLGTNTHKGYIFLSSMLLIARWHARSSDESAVRETLSSLSRTFFMNPGNEATNGQAARTTFKSGGIVLESINGFPSLFEEALPAFRRAMAQHDSMEIASFAMLARLMQIVDDTTTLHRAGTAGLAAVKRDGRQLEQIIASGDDHITFLEQLNRIYIGMNLTIGGVADMLALSYGCLIADGEVSTARAPSDTERLSGQA